MLDRQRTARKLAKHGLKLMAEESPRRGRIHAGQSKTEWYWYTARLDNGCGPVIAYKRLSDILKKEAP